MGTNPNLSQGEVLTPGQWNALLASKQDNLNFVPLNSAGGVMTGPLVTTASIAAAAGFNVPPGAAPSLPNPGDIWNVNGQLFIQGPSGNLGINEYQGAVFQITPPAPAGTVSGTGVMMGLGKVSGSACVLTPLYSTRALVSFTGYASSNGSAGTYSVQLFNGTGAAPANGSASTGSVVNTPILGTSVNAGAQVPFTAMGIVTGLVVGTTYWFDLFLRTATGGVNVSINAVNFSITEI